MWKYGINPPKDAPILTDQDPPTVDAGDENPERGNWTNKMEYMLSVTGYAIGAFVIAYFIILVLSGMPLYFLETAIGQFSSQGSINVWRAVPLLQGVGVGMNFASGLISIYYNVIVSYGLFYLFASFQSPLPWATCQSWSDEHCSDTPLVYCNISGAFAANWTQENRTCAPSDKMRLHAQSPSEQYWDRVALQRSSSIEETGPIVWHLALCLLLSSTLTALVLIKGIKSSGKVMYFTSLFPYVALVILLIRGMTLEGARDGIHFFIGAQTNLTKLMEAELWKDAAAQTTFSLGIACGGLVTLASYGKFHNNMFIDSVVICFVNHATSILAGCAIFSVLGHMSFSYQVPIGEVVKDGFGLAFIVYAEALTKLPISTFWSIIFFFMLFTVGLDTQFANIEVISTSIVDAFPKYNRAYISVGCSIITFLLGLPLVTKAGIYWVTLMDDFVSNWVILILALMEIIGFCYVYDLNRLIEDIEMMLGKKSFWFWLWWRACWFIISPCILLGILAWSMKSFEPPNYGGVKLSAWAVALGWGLPALTLIWIPIIAVYKLSRAEGNLWKRLKSTCSPSEDWCPFLDIHRGERYSQERFQKKREQKAADHE